MKLYLKFMVSIRCKTLVKSELNKLGLHYISVEIGEAEINEDISSEQWKELNNALKLSGIELIDDRKKVLVEDIKQVVAGLVRYSEDTSDLKFSKYISQKLKSNYTSLSTIFSESQGKTIRQFFINHKIERIKELLAGDQFNITEIAWKLGYSSSAHLSSQFKKMTGQTPSFYKKISGLSNSALNDN